MDDDMIIVEPLCIVVIMGFLLCIAVLEFVDRWYGWAHSLSVFAHFPITYNRKPIIWMSEKKFWIGGCSI